MTLTHAHLWPRPLTLALTQGNSNAKTRFLAFDLDLWPTTMTFNPNLAKVNLHTKSQGRRSSRSAVRVETDEQTDGRYQVCYLPALRSIKIGWIDGTHVRESRTCIVIRVQWTKRDAFHIQLAQRFIPSVLKIPIAQSPGAIFLISLLSRWGNVVVKSVTSGPWHLK